MTATKQISTSFLTLTAVLSAVRNRFAPVEQAEAPRVPEQTPVETLVHDKMDKARYERILDHELERHIFTQVEREDSDMLNRVREALYAD